MIQMPLAKGKQLTLLGLVLGARRRFFGLEPDFLFRSRLRRLIAWDPQRPVDVDLLERLRILASVFLCFMSVRNPPQRLEPPAGSAHTVHVRFGDNILFLKRTD